MTTDIADLGPFGIVSKTWEIFRRHPKTFLLIQFSLGLPSAVLYVGFEVLVFIYLKNREHDVFQPASAMQTDAASTGVHGLHLDSFRLSVGDCSFLLFHLFTAVVAIGLQVTQAVSIATTIYAVGLVLDGEKISFCDLVKRAVPTLWKRLVYTLLSWNLLFQSAAYAYIGLVYLGAHCGAKVAIVILSAVFAGIGSYLSLIYLLASGVSVLEEKCGWKALKKASKLLEEKWCCGVGLQLVYAVPGALAAWATYYVHIQLKKDPKCPAVIVLLVGQVIVGTFVSQLYSISAGVTYTSFKAYHGLTLVGNFLVGSSSKEGYQMIGSKPV